MWEVQEWNRTSGKWENHWITSLKENKPLVFETYSDAEDTLAWLLNELKDCSRCSNTNPAWGFSDEAYTPFDFRIVQVEEAV